MPLPSEFPCPNCQQDLLLDEDTAGREVECPYCEERVLLPKLTAAQKAEPIAVKPVLPTRRKSAPQESETPAVEQLKFELDAEPAVSGKKNFPLHKSQPVAEPEDELEVEKTPLPPGKEKTAEEEQRRLAAMAAKVGYDHEKYEKKGMIAFACPLCQRPLWVGKKDEGKIVNCGGCASDVAAPIPKLGVPAQLIKQDAADAGNAKVRKAVLPQARKSAPESEETPPSTPKQKAGGGSGPMPKLNVTAPTENAGAPPVALPSERISQARTVGAKRVVEPVAPEPEPEPEPPPPPPAPKRQKGALRLNNERKVFSPQKDLSTDLEVAEAWGQSEEKAPVSRRYMIIAWIALVPIIMAVLIWGIKASFAKKPVETVSTKATEEKNEARVVHVATAVLQKYFEAKTVEDMAKYVRHPEKTIPRMQSLYSRRPPEYKFQSFTNTKVGNLDGIDFLQGVLTLSGEKPRSIALEIPAEGSANPDDLRIDWESFVYWSDVSWDEFLRQQMEKRADFRVILQRDNYYVAPYDDESRWICFKIYNPASDSDEYGYCFGYVDAESDVARDLIQPTRIAAERGQQSLNAIVRLRFRPEARRKNMASQVSIEKFTSGWLIPRE